MDVLDTDALMAGCVFCRIAAGEIPATVVHRDEQVIAIEDLNPQAPTHLLVLPVEHHDGIVEVSNANGPALKRLIDVASKLGRERGGEAGFRLVINAGPNGGQTVGHVHVHVLAGRRMAWPPG
ncbi:MAG TPA: HIT domain-containing protein [Candidatus Babeliales bacterium]|nr:HIT domain-containing protein [Candidatus Babeliales bacterium]